MKTKLLTLIIGLACGGALAQTNKLTENDLFALDSKYSIVSKNIFDDALKYQQRNWQEITNIVIDEKFKGTIQVGDKFFTVKDLQSLPNTSIALTVSTNWTDEIYDGGQLGYQVTNHILTVIYRDATNAFTLEQDTGQFVFGGTKAVTGLNVLGQTNTWHYITNGGFTHQVEYKNGQFESFSQWGFNP